MEFVNWHSKTGNRTAIIVKEGRKWMQVVIFDGAKGVRLRRVSRTERRNMRPAFRPDGSEYPLRKAIGRYMELARRYGITKGAYDSLIQPTTSFTRKLDAINRKTLLA
jgi:hypothetical protein